MSVRSPDESARVLVAALAALALGGCPAPEAKTEATVQYAQAGGGAGAGDSSAAAVTPPPACLTYGAWRTTATSAGPSYPLPVFAADVERRCVIAYQDVRSDIVTILPAGVLPEASGKPVVFGRVPDAGGLSDGLAPGTIEIRAVTSLGGQANADAMLASPGLARPPVIRAGYPRGLEATQRGITITADLPRAALAAAVASLAHQWRPIRAGARGNARLEGLGVAANWHRVPDGRHVWSEVGVIEQGDDPNAQALQWEKRGSSVVAYVHPLESDNVACYAGTLDARGKLTKLKFTDPVFGGEGDAPAVQSVGDIWPDHLVARAIRPASPAARRKIRELGGSGGGPDLCRRAFAKPGKMGLPEAPTG